jgi:hypothetical protein
METFDEGPAVWLVNAIGPSGDREIGSSGHRKEEPRLQRGKATILGGSEKRFQEQVIRKFGNVHCVAMNGSDE